MFAISPEIRISAGRLALSLPDLPETLRARHLACLFHNLVTAGRPEEARAILEEARAAVASADDARASFTLRFAESALEYTDDRFGLVARADHLRLSGRDLRRRRSAPSARTHVARRAAERRRPLRRGTHDRGRRPRRRAARPPGLGLPDVRDLAWPHAASDRTAQRSARGTRGTLRARRRNTRGRGARRRRHRRARASGHPHRRRTPGSSPRRHRAGHARTRHTRGTAPRGWLLALFAMAEGDAESRHEGGSALQPNPTAGRSSRGSRSTSPTKCRSHASRLATRDDELAQLALSNSRRRAELNPGVASIAATAAHVRGLLEPSTRGSSRGGRALRAHPRRLELAAALEDLGVALIASDREAAIEALGRTLALYTELGASWDARRVRSRLRELGVRRRLVAAEPETNGWAALTSFGAYGRAARRRGTDESRGRRTALCLATHRQQPSSPRLLEARHQLTRRAGAPRSRSRNRVMRAMPSAAGPAQARRRSDEQRCPTSGTTGDRAALGRASATRRSAGTTTTSGATARTTSPRCSRRSRWACSRPG